MEMSDQVRALLEEAGEVDDLARAFARANPDDLRNNPAGETAKLSSGVVLELAALRLTVEAAVVASLEPQRFASDGVEEVAAGWYRIELMGHRRRHGYVRPVRLAGRQLVEIEQPVALVGLDGEPTGQWSSVVERYAAAAIFSLQESSEDDAREETTTIPF